MKTIKFHLESIDIFYFDKQGHPILCRDFVKDVLLDCPSKITVWISLSKKGNIVVKKPDDTEIHFLDYCGSAGLRWGWSGEDAFRPIFQALRGMLVEGRYNVYISEGWV